MTIPHYVLFLVHFTIKKLEEPHISSGFSYPLKVTIVAPLPPAFCGV